MIDRRYSDDVEIIEIDDCDIEIIEIDDDFVSSLPPYSKKINDSFLSNVRKKLFGNKIAIVTTCTAILVVTLTGVFFLRGKFDNKTILKSQSRILYSTVSNDDFIFELNDKSYTTISINEPYEEKGVSLVIDGVDYSSDVVINSSSVDTSKTGIYHVVYTYTSDNNQVRTIYRTIIVTDNQAPTIKLLGSSVYTMLVNGNYEEAGVLVSDNSGENLLQNVVIDSNVDVNTPGFYNIRYSVSDSNGNSSYVDRTVVVKYSFASSTNSVLTNRFTDNGIYLTGMVSVSNFRNQIILKNKDTGNESVVDVIPNGYNYYQLNLDVTGLENGNYDFYLVSDILDSLVSNMSNYNRIVRAHVGNKLVTMSYDNNIVNMKVEDFQYLYDVVIDPGHGGDEFGAVNGNLYEKSINLEQSLYEKQRFEAHGLKVLLLRDTDDNYGIMMGDEKFERIDRKAFAVGYYGAVSKIIYSNHHNSSSNSSSAGWEILVPASATYDDLLVEHKIADEWSNMYIQSTDPYYRFYTKDFEKATPSNKINGEVYDFEDYYSVLRLSRKLFNVKNVLYEGAYMNNDSDMNWYYYSGNWKKLSEVKIKNYVESIGVKYIQP